MAIPWLLSPVPRILCVFWRLNTTTECIARTLCLVFFDSRSVSPSVKIYDEEKDDVAKVPASQEQLCD